MKYFSLFIPLLLLLFTSCKDSSGPCEYYITEIRANVLSIEPYKEKDDTTQLYHIVMRLNESSLAKQNQFLEDLVPGIKGKTDSGFLERNNIKVGNIYPGTVSEIKSGECQPVYISFNFYFKTP